MANGKTSIGTSLSSGLRRRTSSVSLTVYQWSRIHDAYANATENEPDAALVPNPRGLGQRSISGPCLQSPSRSIATQTPTEHFSFEFPSHGNGEIEIDVTDILNRQSLPDVVPPRFSTRLAGAREIGQDLRVIADNLDRIGYRNRSFSMERSQRRRSYSES